MIRTRQPQGVVRPRSIRNLTSVVLPTAGAFNLVTNNPVTIGGSITRESCPYGIAFRNPASSATDYIGSGVTGAQNLTILAIVSRDEDTTTSGIKTVQVVAHTRTTNGSDDWIDLNLGNGFGAGGDKNKPRIATSSTGGVAGSAWLNGIKYTSVNPVPYVLTTGTFYPIAATFTGRTETDEIWFSGGENLQYALSGRILAFAVVSAILPDSECSYFTSSIPAAFDYLFAPTRRVWVQLAANEGTGGTTTNERTVAARTKARGAATTTAIHAATTAGRIRARAADVVVPIHVETVAGRVTARGADARTSIHAGTAAGRIKARGTDTVAPLRTESAAGRIRAKATNTVEHIDAGAVSRTIAGKVRARGAAATLAIRNTSIVGRLNAKAAETGTSTRLSLAAGRVRTRAAIAAAPVIAGMITTTAAGRIQARGAVATTATRIEAIAGRVTARGTDTANSIRAATAAGRLRGRGAAAAGPYVAPTLPLEVPESTRVLVDKTERLGASSSPTIWDPVLNRRVPAPRKPPRLG